MIITIFFSLSLYYIFIWCVFYGRTPSLFFLRCSSISFSRSKKPGDTTESTHVKVLVLETRTPRTVHQVRVSFNSTTTKPHQCEVPCCTVQILLLQL